MRGPEEVYDEAMSYRIEYYRVPMELPEGLTQDMIEELCKRKPERRGIEKLPGWYRSEVPEPARRMAPVGSGLRDRRGSSCLPPVTASPVQGYEGTDQAHKQTA